MALHQSFIDSRWDARQLLQKARDANMKNQLRLSGKLDYAPRKVQQIQITIDHVARLRELLGKQWPQIYRIEDDSFTPVSDERMLEALQQALKEE